MANKLKITETQFNRIKHRLLETEDINSTLDYIKVRDGLFFKGNYNLRMIVININFTTDEVVAGTLINGKRRKIMFKLNSYDEITRKFSYQLFDENGENPVGQTYEPKSLDIIRGGQIVDIPGDASKAQTTGKKTEPTQTPKDDVSEPIDLDPTIPTKNPEDRTDAERAKTLKKYYDEIINDPNLKQAFYQAPSFWNYITAVIKGEPAKGKGIGPALNLVNKYKDQESKKKAPGFTIKQNQTAKFKISKSVNINYVTENNVKGSIGISNGAENSAIVQQNTTIGNNALKTLVNSNVKYKLDVLERTKTPNVFVCIFSVYGVTGVKNDEVYSDKVNVRFTQSLGYNEETNTTK